MSKDLIKQRFRLTRKLDKWLGNLKRKIDASYLIWKKVTEFENQLLIGSKYKH